MSNLTNSFQSSWSKSNRNNNKNGSNVDSGLNESEKMSDTSLMANPWVNSGMKSSPLSKMGNNGHGLASTSVAHRSMPRMLYKSQSDGSANSGMDDIDADFGYTKGSQTTRAVHVMNPHMRMNQFPGMSAMGSGCSSVSVGDYDFINDTAMPGMFKNFGLSSENKSVPVKGMARMSLNSKINNNDNSKNIAKSDLGGLGQLPGLGSLGGLSDIPIPPSKVSESKIDEKTDNNETEQDGDNDEFNMEMIYAPPPKLTGLNSPAMSGTSNTSSNFSNFVEPICKGDGCCVKPQNYNLYTTCTMVNTPSEVLVGLEKLLLQYASENPDKREIDFAILPNDFMIEGTVYIKHKSVKFAISVWHETEQEDNLARVEFQKRRGDSILFQQFWSEMLELIVKYFSNVGGAERCEDFESYFMPAFDLGDDYIYKNSDLDNMAMDLEDDYRDEALDVLATICEEMEKSSFCKLVSEHERIMKVLIEQTLCHFDTCHVRGGLCALSKMLDSGVPCLEQLVSKSCVMSKLPQLLNNPSKIIQKRAIQVMSQLSKSKSNWNLAAESSNEVKSSVMQLVIDFEDAATQQMLENIKGKVDAESQ